DPASLFNACRAGAAAAVSRSGAWGHSNWSGTRAERRAAVIMLHTLREGLPALQKRLFELRPNLILIGSMSICLPGALACARYAKALLGDQVCVVLGGRHASETIYRLPDGSIEHHPSSPLRLMAESYTDSVFDVVIAGEGEHAIVALGELVDATV